MVMAEKAHLSVQVAKLFIFVDMFVFLLIHWFVRFALIYLFNFFNFNFLQKLFSDRTLSPLVCLRRRAGTPKRTCWQDLVKMTPICF